VTYKDEGRNDVAPLILLVDDDPMMLDVIQSYLRPHYRLRLATRGREALASALQSPLPDLILLDVKLPDMHGYDVCKLLKEQVITTAIPIIFLSSHSDVDNITRGLELGAVDYVSKPVAAAVLLARVKTHLRLREANSLLRDQNAHLESLVLQRTSELQQSQELTIVALGSIAETRDNETGNHIHRTRAYVAALTERLARTSRYQHNMTGEQWRMIWKSAPLHDIGKVGIPDQILLKPGKLTAAEFAVMKHHPGIGRDALRAAEQRMNAQNSFLAVAQEIAYSHHERWDGGGYPEGLAGTAIPLSARLMALADVYDALISRRVYKSAYTHAVAVAEIRAGRGSHFDPEIVDCFLDDTDEFDAIATRFADHPEKGP
jgi:putative two-component system response regulator